MIIGPTSHKGEVFGGLGLRCHKRTFFDMPSSHGVGISPPPSLEHSRCFNVNTKGADGAADLLEVLRNSPLEMLYLGRCSHIPSAAWQKLRGASWTNLREANFSWCLVLQTSLRCLASSLRRRVLFFPLLKAIVTAVSLTTFDNIERPNMWNRQLQMVGLTKVTCKRSGNRLPSFYPHRPLLITPGALTKTPKVPMGLQTCWKSCATLPWRSWTFSIALKFRPLRGRSCVVPAGPIWEKQSSLGASSCKFCFDVWSVCWDAVFFSWMLRVIVTAVSLTAFDSIERPKMWNRQLQMVGLANVTCKRSGNRLPSFYRLPRIRWHTCVIR